MEEAKKLFNQITEGNGGCYVPDYLIDAVFDIADENGYEFACVGKSMINISTPQAICSDMSYNIVSLGRK